MTILQKSMGSRFWTATAYFVLAAAVEPLIILSSNMHRLTVQNAVLGFALLFAVLTAVRIAAALIFRRPAVSDPIIALAAIALLYNEFIGAYPGKPVFWLWIGGLAVLAAAVLWSPKVRQPVERGLVIFLAVFAATLMVEIVRDDVWSQRNALRAALDRNYPPVEAPAQGSAPRPDIFYIVFDRYARADILAERYGYDNSDFLDELRSRGFAVADDAYSTYQRTAHSLTSVLNMDFIGPVGIKSNDWVPLYEKLSQPRVMSFLDDAGYEVRAYGSWWEPTRASGLAGFNDAYFAVPESLRPLSEHSFLARMLAASGIDFLDPRKRHCWRIHHKFNALKELAPGEQPVFVFAHFLVPHPPFVIHEDGRCKSIAAAKARTRAENYTEQVTFTNTATLKLVDTIIARNPDAIIVLQADEGPWPEEYAGEEIENFGWDVSSPNWLKVPAEELREKMAILSAVRMPGQPGAQFEEGFAPVNTFRVILREVFGVPLENLPRRAMIFKSGGALYDFQDMLEKVESADDDEGGAAGSSVSPASRPGDRSRTRTSQDGGRDEGVRQ